MIVEKTNIEDVIIIIPKVFNDDRGYFYESFQQERYSDAGINFSFVQDNISKSKRGTIRGLHYQTGNYAQGKLCTVLSGEVLDVAVDIRYGSPTFGKYVEVLLTWENKKQLWIPPGFAHGFAVLSEEAVFSYKCTSFYNKESERSILYNDPDIGIQWGISNPVVSEKDLKAGLFSEAGRDFIYENSKMEDI